MQESTEEHPKPPPPIHGSLNDTVTETLRALVKDARDFMYAVGGIVSAKWNDQMGNLQDLSFCYLKLINKAKSIL